MKIASLKVVNYRSIENIDLSFPSYYSAICGKNDSGKTNLVRAIRSLLGELPPFRFRDRDEFSFKDDFTKWKVDSDSKQMSVGVEILVDKESDAGLYEFITTYLALEAQPRPLVVRLEAVYKEEGSPRKTTLEVAGQTFEGIKAEEVFKKIQSSHGVLFYNSTETDPSTIFGRGTSGVLGEYTGKDSTQVEKLKKNVNRALGRIAKRHQSNISELLGRFESKHKVGMSLHTFELEYLPFSITLGDRKTALPLEDWGSGTRNRTLILLTLLRARQISQSGVSASKITPIIVIEEPESFLHPSAQAEFAGILQDLAEEFKVQVLATTHSPYMLSQDRPSSNILLERKVQKKQVRQTVRIETSDANWMEPFGRALGVDNRLLEPWKDLFFSKSKCILLVEGETDREYFELLRDPIHKTGQLRFEGEIFPYHGRDNLKNAVLLRFIRERYSKVFMTFDLDAEAEITKHLSQLGFKRREHYCAVGLSQSGKRDIEGLVPDDVTSVVYSAQSDLVKQAMNGSPVEKKSAKQRLKALILAEFKGRSTPGEKYFKKFYELTRVINKAFR
jgi:energy-coupling factor transporter ATP-binding protein EcfA2